MRETNTTGEKETEEVKKQRDESAQLLDCGRDLLGPGQLSEQHPGKSVEPRLGHEEDK